MRNEFAKHKIVVVYVDGACLNNPGPAAGSACFYGKKVSEKEKNKRMSREKEPLATDSDTDDNLNTFSFD